MSTLLPFIFQAPVDQLCGLLDTKNITKVRPNLDSCVAGKKYMIKGFLLGAALTFRAR
ncbi:hypothetical protein F511_40183 [Dorcoceras hygrometricum]|uniref:Uncharacterized protein n=1 Tax=Dorcoceras hygrometricum TaxID=472368 RepID=A0A2Z7DBP4_9LAMI|nr:hypothetical protein F511_40183 [Dorcoceras hygrometricum]